LHFKLHKNVPLQRRITLKQADQIQEANEKIPELEKKLEEAQGISPTTPLLSSIFLLVFAYSFLVGRCLYLSLTL
jgi:transposase